MDHPEIKQPGTSAGHLMRFGGGRHDMQGKVEKLPPSLQLLQRAVRLKAEVIAQNRDGTVRLKTSEGEINLRLKSRDLPPPGKQVEIDLPAGKPPRQAVIRPAPDHHQPPQSPQESQNASNRAAAERGEEAPAPAAHKSAALSQETARNLSQEIDKAAPPPRKVALRPGDLVRLTPLPPPQVENIRPLTPEAVIPASLEILARPVSTALALPVAPETQHALKNLPLSAQPTPAGYTARTILTGPAPHAQALMTPDAPPVSLKPLSPALTPALLSGGARLNMPALSPDLAPVLISGSFPENGGVFIAEGLDFASVALKVTPPVWDIAIRDITLPPPALLAPSESATKPHPMQNDGSAKVQTPVAKTCAAKTGAPAAFLSGTSPQAGSEGDTNQISISAPAFGSPNTPGFVGTAIGQTPGGFPVIALSSFATPEVKYFTLNIPASNIWEGSQISFTTLPSRAGSAAMTGHSSIDQLGYSYNALSSLLPLPGASWPALEQLQATISQIAPQLASVTSRAIPSPASPQQLPAAALLFIAAVKAGDISGWLGQKITDTLRRAGKGEILEKLGRDFATLQKSTADPVTQDWRSLSLPLAWQDDIHHATIFYRQDGSGDEKDKERKRTRFIFNLELTRMGSVQLDGLHRQERLDLIVRTQTPLSPAMQRTMRQHYSKGLESVDVRGELSFQFKPEQWIKIEPDTTPGITA